MHFNDKLSMLSKLRSKYRSKKIILDDSKDKLGLNEMYQLTVRKDSKELKGIPFRIQFKNISDKIGLKIIPVDERYSKIEHPCFLENITLKTITDEIILKKRSPHFVHYIGSKKISNSSRGLKHLNFNDLYKKYDIKNYSNVLLSEYVNEGSLDNWIYNIYENDKEISSTQWKIIVFQLVQSIYTLQKHFKMMHNDCHYGNILIDTSISPGGYLVYHVDNDIFYIPNTGVLPKLWDFEFSMSFQQTKNSNLYPNKFITGCYQYDYTQNKTIIDSDTSDIYTNNNVPYNYNEVYDLHYCLTSLLDLFISEDLYNWIINLYPDELLPEDTDSNSSFSNDSNYSSNSVSKDSGYSSISVSDDSGYSSISYDSCSSSDSDTSSYSINTDSISNTKFLKDGRLINGIENSYNLVTPKELLKNDFFKCFLIKPFDYTENNSIHFYI